MKRDIKKCMDNSNQTWFDLKINLEQWPCKRTIVEYDVCTIELQLKIKIYRDYQIEIICVSYRIYSH